MASQEAIRAITLFTPAVVSGAIFAYRRAKKGAKAIANDDTAYGIMNIDIAAGQTLKGLRAGRALTIASDSLTSYSSSEKIFEMSKAAKAAEGTSKFGSILKQSKIASGLGKIIDATANNINPIIIAAGGVKVLTSEDKIDAFDREALGLGCMFGAEAIAKRVLGMPILEKSAVTGKMISKPRKSILENTAISRGIDKLFGESQKAALNDSQAVKMFFDKIPADALKSGLKGALFVCASILGYKLGVAIANKLLGEEKTNKAKA